MLLEWVRENLPMDLDFAQKLEAKVMETIEVNRDEIERAYEVGAIDNFLCYKEGLKFNMWGKDYYNKFYNGKLI